MNYSEAQLDALDQLMERYFASRYSQSALLTEWLDDVRNHSVFRWILESTLEMKLRTKWLEETPSNAISHRDYQRIKSQCNALFNALSKLYRSINAIRRNIDRQWQLQRLLFLPGFIDEERELKELRKFEGKIEIQRIEIHRLYFRHCDLIKEREQPLNDGLDEVIDATTIEKEIRLRNGNDTELESTNSESADIALIADRSERPLRSDFVLLINSPIVFECGKMDGICGRNESGKSSMMDILCKLYRPQFMECTVNDDIDFALIPRVELRDQICYISQQTALVPGTIGENIHFANPQATVDAVESAAKISGVFWSEEMKSKDARRGRQKGKGSGRRGRGRKRGKRTIATAMVEGIVKWGKHKEEENGNNDNREVSDIGNGSSMNLKQSGWGIYEFLKSFIVTADRKQMESENGKQRSDSLGIDEEVHRRG